VTAAVAVVTGAASGIGQAVAAALRATGADVLGIDRQDGPGIAALDLARPDAGEGVRALLGARQAAMLVNAAAVFHSGGLEATDAGDWDRLYHVNLRAPYLLARALTPDLIATRGAIVNVSSVNGQRNARANFAYDSLKAGLDHLTRGLALELGQHGVRVNAVAPGGTGTTGLGQWLNQSGRGGPSADEVMAGLVTAGQIAHPAQIADVVVFLLSPAASWINGAIILADNAAHLRMGQEN